MPEDAGYPLVPHAENCQCDYCRKLWAAILAQTPEGEPEFTDDELMKMAKELSKPCDLGDDGGPCDGCRELDEQIERRRRDQVKRLNRRDFPEGQ